MDSYIDEDALGNCTFFTTVSLMDRTVENNMENVTVRASTEKCETDLGKAQLPILLVLSLILGFVSVFVLYRMKATNSHVHHFLTSSLALNDLVTTLLCTIMWIGNVTVCGKFGGDLVCSIQGWLATGMVIWSAWVVVVMTAVRYLSVAKPFYYKINVTVTKLKYALLVTLVFTLLTLIFPFTNLVNPYKLYWANFVCAYDFSPGAGGMLHRSVLLFISCLGLSTVGVVLFLNGRILCVLRRTRIIAPSRSDGLSGIRERRSSYANLQTKLVSCVYCICYGPFLLRILYDVIVNSDKQDDTRHSVTTALLFMCPLLNPFVYVICNKNFRQYIVGTFHRLLTKCGIRKRDERPVAVRSGNRSDNQTSVIAMF